MHCVFQSQMRVFSQSSVWQITIMLSGCSRPPFSTYAERHAAWRAEGRVLFFCGESPSTGAFLIALSAAYSASVLSERALLLACTRRHRSLLLPSWLGSAFHGRHYDWSDSHLSDRERLWASESPSIWLNKYKADSTYVFNRTCVAGVDVGSGSVTLHADEHRTERPIFSVAANAARFEAIAGVQPSRVSLQTCALQSLLVPSAALLALSRTLTNATRFSALHVRLGDGNMLRAGGDREAGMITRKFKRAREQRVLERGFSRDEPRGMLSCLGRPRCRRLTWWSQTRKAWRSPPRRWGC